MSLRFFLSSFSNTFLSLFSLSSERSEQKVAKIKKIATKKCNFFSPLKRRISSQILHSAESVSLTRSLRPRYFTKSSNSTCISTSFFFFSLVPRAARVARFENLSLRVASECVCVCVCAFYAIPNSSTGSSHEEKDDDEQKGWKREKCRLQKRD